MIGNFPQAYTTRDKIRRLTIRGYRVPEIARILDVSDGYVRKTIKTSDDEWDAPPTVNHWAGNYHVVVSHTCKALEIPVTHIAKYLNVGRKTVYSYLKRSFRRDLEIAIHGSLKHYATDTQGKKFKRNTHIAIVPLNDRFDQYIVRTDDGESVEMLKPELARNVILDESRPY